MKERPILFSGPMVRAILEGRKTQTRRVINPQPKMHRTDNEAVPSQVTGFELNHYGVSFLGEVETEGTNSDRHAHARPMFTIKNPYGQPGDRLWVRESLGRRPASLLGIQAKNGVEEAFYRADEEPVLNPDGFNYCPTWKNKVCPPMHMPQWASRISLEITEIRVERLQDISELDALAEGAEPCDHRGYHTDQYTCGFKTLWDSINSKRDFGWDTNPWVWVVRFKKVEVAK